VTEQAVKGLHFVEKHLCEAKPDHKRFLSQFSLGIITRLQNCILDNSVDILVKLKAVRGLHSMIKFIDDGVSNISPQILGLLQIIIEDDELFGSSIEVWDTFIKVLPNESLVELFVQISLNLIQNHKKCNSIQTEKIVQIFKYLTVDNLDLLKPFFGHIAHNIPENEEWKEVKDHISNFFPNERSFIGKLCDISSQLTHENGTVIYQTLQKLKKLLEIKSLEMQLLLISEPIDLNIKRLVKQLFVLNRNNFNTNKRISVLCCECIGIIGAVDPSRMDVSLENDQLFGIGYRLSSVKDVFNFACNLIETHFTPAFKSTHEPQLQNILAFTIQEILKWCGFNSDIVAQAEQGTDKEDDLNTVHIKRWKEFPKSVLSIISPLIGSRYHIPPLQNTIQKYPIFPCSQSHNEWIRSWAINLLQSISKPKVQKMFKICEHLIISHDSNLVQLLLPHLVLNVLIDSSDAEIKELKLEFIEVLGAKSESIDNEQKHLSIQVLFNAQNRQFFR
jgi:serine/threonine-protein kinase ATR